MLLGIDVGGTFTDAVVVGEGCVVAQAKQPTTDELLSGILDVLDSVLDEVKVGQIERIALSTTYVTNALVQGKISSVGLLLIPGPGLDYSGLLPTHAVMLDGYTDHRGRETAPLRREQVEQACVQFKYCDAVAVSGKFSVRNPRQENQAADWVERLAGCHVTRGAETSGGLNFLRRTNSAYYNAAVWQAFNHFADAAERAIKLRGLQAPLYILKADGGTIPLDIARRLPVETIFTGPAATVLGIMATSRPVGPAVSLDIGGTTTDIALWRDGVPLSAPRGVTLDGYPTAVRSFRLRSVGIGGDSVVRRNEQRLTVGPDRMGPAVALGGPAPTLSDAMIVAGIMQFGDAAKARQAMNSLACLGETPEIIALQILDIAVGTITREIESMICEHFSDPVYRVEDILMRKTLQPKTMLVVGGAGQGLAPLIAEYWRKQTGISCKLEIPPHAMITNAVGAAVARPTLSLTVRADSEQGYYSVPELGVSQKLERNQGSVSAIKKLAEDYLLMQAHGAKIAAGSLETVLSEEFNLVRGFQTVGKNILLKMQITPGVLTTVSGKGAV